MNIPNNSTAEILDTCLINIQSGKMNIEECLSLYPDLRVELEPLIILSVELEKGRQVKASEEFRSVSHIRMENLIRNTSLHSQESKSRKSVYNRNKWMFEWNRNTGNFRVSRKFSVIAFMVVILFAVSLLTTGVVIAADNSLPGDVFHPVKLSFERLQLNLASSEVSRSQLYLNFSTRRLEEIKELIDANRIDQIDPILEEYTLQISKTLKIIFDDPSLTKEEKLSLADEVDKKLAQNEELLFELFSRIPFEYREIIQSALKSSRNHRVTVIMLINGTPEEYQELLKYNSKITKPPDGTNQRPQFDADVWPLEETEIFEGIGQTRTAKPDSWKTPMPFWNYEGSEWQFDDQIYWPYEWYFDEENEWPATWPTPPDWLEEWLTAQPEIPPLYPPILPTGLPIGKTSIPTDLIPLIRTPFPPVP
jgi:hypothetical protein